jgi:uncharacterized protein YggE
MYADRAVLAAALPMDAADQTYDPGEMKFNATVTAQYELEIP